MRRDSVIVGIEVKTIIPYSFVQRQLFRYLQPVAVAMDGLDQTREKQVFSCLRRRAMFTSTMFDVRTWAVRDRAIGAGTC